MMLGPSPWRGLILILTSFTDRQVLGEAQQLCSDRVFWEAAISLSLLSLAFFFFDPNRVAFLRMQIRAQFQLPDDLTEEEKLEPVRNFGDDPKIRLLNRLYEKKRKVCALCLALLMPGHTMTCSNPCGAMSGLALQMCRPMPDGVNSSAERF